MVLKLEDLVGRYYFSNSESFKTLTRVKEIRDSEVDIEYFYFGLFWTSTLLCYGHVSEDVLNHNSLRKEGVDGFEELFERSCKGAEFFDSIEEFLAKYPTDNLATYAATGIETPFKKLDND